MLPKKNRIPKEDFPTPKMQGVRIFSPLFSGVVYKTTTETGVSVVVSKKTAKTAVMRNRIRRRMYDAIRSRLSMFKYQALVVCYPKKEVATVVFADLKSEIEWALIRAKIL